MTNVFDGLVFHLLGRLIAHQFVVFGGVPAVLQEGEILLKNGIIPTYNRIDEHVSDKRQLEGIFSSYIELVYRMDFTNHGQIAIKPSAFGMELGSFVFARALQRFIDAIKGRRLEIEIDAERCETLCDVQHVLNVLAPKLPEGITFRPALQMHLPRALREKLITEYHILDMPLRIVKGSGLYAVGDKEATGAEVLLHYEETFRKQIANGKHPNIATVRDQKLIERLLSIAARLHIPVENFTLQFLAGPFGRSLAQQYAAKGYRVGCYLPFVDPSYPDEWKGYVRRRIAFGRKLIVG